jgi:hypothetical protein
MHESSWDTRKRQIVAFPLNHTSDVVYECVFDPITLARQRTGPESFDEAVGHPLQGKRYVRLEDRSVYFDNVTTLEHCIMGVVGTVVTPEGPPLPVSFRNANVFPGRSNTEVWIGERFSIGSNGRGIFYDTITREFSSPLYHLGMGTRSVVYATDLGVLVSGHDYPSEGYTGGLLTRRQLRIWSLEVEPTTVSPVEVAGGTVKSGQVVTYRVQVTGAQNDPAEGELVDWTLEGAGTLLDPQSKTDVDGYAITKVQYPVVEIEGSSVITASVTC